MLKTNLGKALALIVLACLPLMLPHWACAKAYEGTVEQQEDAEARADRGAVGISFMILVYPHGETRVTVKRVVENSPAQLFGLRKGDELISVDGHPVAHLPHQEIGKLIRGNPGTALTMVVSRHGRQLTFTGTRSMLGKISDRQFRSELTKQYEATERAERLTRALYDLMIAAGSPQTFASASPPLSPAELSATIDGANEARFCLERNDFKGGEERLRAVLRRCPSLVEARFVYSLLLDQLGRFAEAKPEIEAVVAQRPNSLDARMSLVANERALGNLNAALADLRKAIPLCKTPEQENLVRSKITAIQDELVANSTPPSVSELLMRAEELIAKKSYEDAERILRQAVAIDPHAQHAWQLIAVCEQRTGGSPKDVADSLKQGFGKPDSVDTGGGGIDLDTVANASPTELQSLVEPLRVQIASAKTAEDSHWARRALAYCLDKQGKSADAVKEYQQLIDELPAADTTRPLLLVAIGRCQLNCGGFTDALANLLRARELSPSIAADPTVSQAIEGLKEIVFAGVQPGTNQNYLSEVTGKGMMRWKKNKVLKVCIQEPQGLNSYKPSFATQVKQAFDKWSEMTGSQFKFEYVTKPSGANIVYFWTDDRSKLDGVARAAITKPQGIGHRMTHADIVMLNKKASAGKDTPFTDEEVYSCALHEIGHALGLLGHSRNRQDVMFPFLHPAVISQRDVDTLTALYAMPEPRDSSGPIIQFLH